MEGYTSPAVLEELTSVLSNPKFTLTNQEIDDAKDYYITVLVTVRPRLKLNIVKENPEDNKVLECVVEANADFIVTGDKHLIGIGEYRGIRIMRAAEFLRIIKGSNSK